MKFLQRRYDVGLLSAAELWGASHQRPQVFHVLVDGTVAARDVGRVRMRFYTSTQAKSAETVARNTPTGRAELSSPARTCLDLCDWVNVSSGMSNVATVAAELVEQHRIPAGELVELAAGYSAVVLRRLGDAPEVAATHGADLGLDLDALAASANPNPGRRGRVLHASAPRRGPVNDRWGSSSTATSRSTCDSCDDSPPVAPSRAGDADRRHRGCSWPAGTSASSSWKRHRGRDRPGEDQHRPTRRHVPTLERPPRTSGNAASRVPILPARCAVAWLNRSPQRYLSPSRRKVCMRKRSELARRDTMSDDCQPVVVAHPDTHPYVAHATGVEPVPDRPSVWDVPGLRAAQVAVVHLHFGFEQRSHAEMVAWMSDLRAAGIALVLTVHDIDNPHLVDQRAFHQLVGALVVGADDVVTLSDAAARSIHDRWGRDVDVLAHPHVVRADEPLARPTVRQGVFIHAATVRPNLDLALIERLAGLAEQLGGVRIHVRDTAPVAAIARLASTRRAGLVRVDVEPRLTDHELWERIGGAGLLVLPYRWGTHSGLLAAAHDLGTPVAATDVGGLIDQGAHPVDELDLLGSLQRAMDRPPSVLFDDRVAAASRLVDEHRRRYRSMLSCAR